MTKVAKTSDIAPGTGKVVDVNGKPIAVFNCDGTFYAVENECKHQGGPLGEGTLSGNTVMCPWHGWEYDVTTGVCQLDSAITVKRFDVKVEGDDILIAA
ncbi:MAG: Rieske 2Fe-2S domain-containing protein [Candidatus Omnitrophica bacterium]|nr:Rieske 2Fe-2S domain-containing protein [Candidatus Omnitrophota bacterium]